MIFLLLFLLFVIMFANMNKRNDSNNSLFVVLSFLPTKISNQNRQVAPPKMVIFRTHLNFSPDFFYLLNHEKTQKIELLNFCNWTKNAAFAFYDKTYSGRNNSTEQTLHLVPQA